MESWKKEILKLPRNKSIEERRKFNVHLRKLQNDELPQEEVMKSVFAVRKLKAGGISEWLWQKPEAITHMENVVKHSKQLMVQIDREGAQNNTEIGLIPTDTHYISLLSATLKVCESKEFKELGDKQKEVAQVMKDFSSIREEHFRSKWSLWKRIRTKWNEASWRDVFTFGALILLLYIVACWVMTSFSFGALMPFCAALGGYAASLQASAMTMKASTLTKLSLARKAAGKAMAWLRCMKFDSSELVEVAYSVTKTETTGMLPGFKTTVDKIVPATKKISKITACLIKNGFAENTNKYENLDELFAGGEKEEDNANNFDKINIEDWGISEKRNHFEKLFLVNLKTMLTDIAESTGAFSEYGTGGTKKWRNKEKLLVNLCLWIDYLLQDDTISVEGCDMARLNVRTNEYNDKIKKLIEL
jgi:hypothetical protein